MLFISFHLSFSIQCYLAQGLPFVGADYPVHHHHHHYHERSSRSAPLVPETFTADHFESPDDENDSAHRTSDAPSPSSQPENSETDDHLPLESSSYYSSSYYPSSYYPSYSSSYWPSAPAPRYRYVQRRKSPPSPARYARALMRARGQTPPTELASKEPEAAAAAIAANETTSNSTSTSTAAPEVTTRKTNSSENDEDHEFYNPKPETVEANESDTDYTGNNYSPVAPVVSSLPVRTTETISSRPFYRSGRDESYSYRSQPRLLDILNPWTPRSSYQPSRLGTWITRTFLDPLIDPY